MNKPFSAIGRIRSFGHAIRGLRIFVASTHNAWLHIAALIVVIVLGVRFQISVTEWLFIIVAAAMVLTTEAINTAIETHMDLTSPDHHPFARDTKDVAAGAVLLAAIAAAIIGLIIFVPHFMALARVS
jgi:diacylglycerol kinase (ATP)